MNYFYNSHFHDINEDKHVINYKDGDVETLNLDNENLKFCAASFSACNSVESTRNHNLNKLFNHFENNSFMKFEAQAFLQYLFAAAYDVGERSFSKTARRFVSNFFPPTEIRSIYMSFTRFKSMIT